MDPATEEVAPTAEATAQAEPAPAPAEEAPSAEAEVVAVAPADAPPPTNEMSEVEQAADEAILEFEATIDALQKEANDLKEANASLRDAMEARDKELGETKAKLVDVSALQDLEALLKEKDDQIAVYRQRITEGLEKNAEALKKKLAELEKVRPTKRAEQIKANFDEEVGRWQKEVEEKDALIAKLQDNMARSRSTQADCEKQLATSVPREAFEARVTELKADATGLRATMAERQADFDAQIEELRLKEKELEAKEYREAMESKVETLAQDINTRDEKIDALEATIEAGESALASERSKLALAIGEEELQAMLKPLQSQVAELQALAVDNRKKDTASLKSTLDGLLKARPAKRLEETVKAFDVEKAKNQEMIDSMQVELNAVKGKLGNVESDNRRLRSENELAVGREEFDARQAALREKLASTKETFSKNMEELVAERQALRDQVDRQMASKVEIEDTLSKTRMELRKTEESLENALGDRDRAAEDLKRLQSSTATMVTLEKAQETYAAKDAQIAELQGTVDGFKEKVVAKINKKLTEIQKARPAKRLEAAQKAFNAEIDNARAETAGVKQELADTQAKLATAEKELRARTEAQAGMKPNEEYDAQVAAIRARVDERLVAFDARMSEIEAERTKANAEIETIRGEKGELTGRIDELSADKKGLEGNILELQGRIQKLERAIEDLKATIAQAVPLPEHQKIVGALEEENQKMRTLCVEQRKEDQKKLDARMKKLNSTRPNKWLEQAKVEFNDVTDKLTKQCDEQLQELEGLRKERTELQTKLAAALAKTETAVERDAYDEAKAEISEKAQALGEMKQELLTREESISTLTKELEEFRQAQAAEASAAVDDNKTIEEAAG